MKILTPIPESEMVLELLRAELKSPRFSGRYKIWFLQHGLSPDTEIQTLAPEARKDLLWSVRPGLFKTFPNDMVWQGVLLGKEDCDKVLYMNEDEWKDFSSGTRRVQDGIKKLHQAQHRTLAQRVAEITEQIQKGQVPPKIILVALPDLERLVLLEGHVRATAYVSSGIYREKEVAAILGTSEKLQDWAWY